MGGPPRPGRAPTSCRYSRGRWRPERRDILRSDRDPTVTTRPHQPDPEPTPVRAGPDPDPARTRRATDQAAALQPGPVLPGAPRPILRTPVELVRSASRVPVALARSASRVPSVLGRAAPPTGAGGDVGLAGGVLLSVPGAAVPIGAMPVDQHVQFPGAVFRGPERRWERAVRPLRLARNVPTAFVLAGGGARGAAQVGMLQALTEWGIRPQAIYGSSVGAINAAGFAGSPDGVGVAAMASLWRRVTREDVFPQGRIPAPWRFFQTRPAVHDNASLRRLVASAVSYERIEDAAVRLQVVATSLADGQVRWLERGPVVDAVLASAALPALLPPVVIDGDTLIDGGVVDNVPLGRAIEHGARRVFVLLCGPMRYTPQPHRRPVEAVLTGFFIAIHARFARELQSLPPGIEVVVLTVDTQPLSRYDDFSSTEALMAAGHANAERVLAFWEAGGVGDAPPAAPGTTRPAAADPLVAPIP